MSFWFLRDFDVGVLTWVFGVVLWRFTSTGRCALLSELGVTVMGWDVGRFLENSIAPAFAKRVLGISAWSQILVGGKVLVAFARLSTNVPLIQRPTLAKCVFVASIRVVLTCSPSLAPRSTLSVPVVGLHHHTCEYLPPMPSNVPLLIPAF